jgi:3-oxoacyl-[acyl-carrier-protein] synthase-3
MLNGKITGIGFYVPDNVVTNDDLAKVIDTSDEWIRERSGIEERRYFLPGKDTVSSMAGAASKMALERAQVEADEIDAIILATITPNYYLPGSAVLLQRELGLCNKAIPAFDIRQSCSGFIYALAMANDFIKAGSYKKVLVTGSEIQSGFLEMTDEHRNTAVLFADGAGAVVVESNDEKDKGILSTHLYSDGTFAEDLMVEYPRSHNRKADFNSGEMGLNMEGRLVFKHAIQKFPAVIMECLESNGYDKEDLDLLIPHQANLRIAEAVRKNLEIPVDKVHNNIMKYGNTTAASIPIALNEAWELGKVKENDLVCLAAFGAGFTWGSCLLRWSF